MSVRTPLFVIAALLANAHAQIAVRGETVHTMAGEPVKDGVVLIGASGKIEQVGPAAQVKVPNGYRQLRARVVTPGLVDARTSVGLAGAMNQPHDQMQLETSAPIQPELRAIDSYNSEDKLVEWVRSFGITTVNTGAQAGALLPGQMMVLKTIGEPAEQNVLVPASMIVATLGAAGLNEQQGKSPGTRSKAAAMLRAELQKAKEYDTRKATEKDDKKPATDLRMEILARVTRGELPLLVNAYRAQDILTALRIAKEFNLKLILDGAAEAHMVLPQIKAAGVPVIVHPTMARAAGDAENLSMETAASLKKAGIPIAIESGYEGYVPKTRVVLFEAAVAAANGLSFREALAAVTIDAARLIGVDKRVGSLEPGKDGDLAMFDGDPFEYTTHVTGVVIDGRVVSEKAQ